MNHGAARCSAGKWVDLLRLRSRIDQKFAARCTQPREKRQHVSVAELLACDDMSLRIHCVNLEQAFSENRSINQTDLHCQWWDCKKYVQQDKPVSTNVAPPAGLECLLIMLSMGRLSKHTCVASITMTGTARPISSGNVPPHGAGAL
jgi:hypothetical protein